MAAWMRAVHGNEQDQYTCSERYKDRVCVSI